MIFQLLWNYYTIFILFFLYWTRIPTQKQFQKEFNKKMAFFLTIYYRICHLTILTFSVRRIVETLISPVYAHNVNDTIRYINIFMFLTLFLQGWKKAINLVYTRHLTSTTYLNISLLIVFFLRHVMV